MRSDYRAPFLYSLSFSNELCFLNCDYEEWGLSAVAPPYAPGTTTDFSAYTSSSIWATVVQLSLNSQVEKSCSSAESFWLAVILFNF
jgi:hypothetical protein